MGAIGWCCRAGIKLLLFIIKLLLCTIFLGILVMWIMVPTDTYHQWKTSISNVVADYTYFGEQGTNLLFWTCPMLFISVLGCFYLHLRNKLKDYPLGRNGKKDSPTRWRRPVLVRGRLGIVSGIEIVLLLMFVALLVWSSFAYTSRAFSSITPEVAAEAGENVWELKLQTAPLRLGLVANICLAFLFFPVARGSSVLPLLGLTSEASIKYHIWLGHIAMVLSTAHGIGYIIYWAATNQLPKINQWTRSGISNIAGEISLAAGLVMWATTFPCIRRRTFELFFYTHYLYIPFVVFFVLHVGTSFTFMMLPGFYLFMVDRYLRFLQSRTAIRLLSARILPCDTLELNFSKSHGWDYNPRSTIFINIPSISKLQWHPFTITSSSKLEPEKLSVVLKCGGSWTAKLYHMLSPPSPVDQLDVSIEGPYGPTATNFLGYDKLVMVSGGSGITPFISIIRELIFLSRTPQLKLPQVLLICSFKKSSELAMVELILPIASTPSALSNLQLQIKAYVTREAKPQKAYSKLILNLWFKARPTDVPVSPSLGPNNWLLLGAIIFSSFTAFLILMGISTWIIRYYHIYSIDQNKNIYSNSYRAILTMLLLCVSVVGTASAVVFRKKRKYGAASNKQVHNVEGVIPAGSPEPCFSDADHRELGSHLQESLVKATQVHYKERPDLKRILFELKATSVGVMVCGPKKMRQEVARICSSGLANNLHYQFISFSW